MSTYASPVSSPPFKYTSSSGLYVDTPIYEGRHRRCSSSRLYELLTYEDPGPAYTKAGKLKVHQPPKHRDEPQHFYTAQCVHYGLRPFKPKQAARNALLAAYEGSTNRLTVPEDILGIEKLLAAEYKTKNEAAEKEYRQRRKLQEEAEEKQRKKRKRDEEALLAEVLADSCTSGNGAKKSKPNKPPEALDIATFQGVYQIAAPEVSEGWDCGGPLTLTFAPSEGGSHLWGSFDFGVFEGTLRSCSSTEPKHNTIRFLWRGRETGEGESTYGDENVARFNFLGNGKFTGSMYWDCLGDFDLVGQLDVAASRNKVFSGCVDGWKGEYWSINDSNYERERVGRWGGGGGWGYGGDSEAESNSDTGNEHGGKDEEEDEEGEDEETGDRLGY